MKKGSRRHHESIIPSAKEFRGVGVVPDATVTNTWGALVEALLHRTPPGELHFPIGCATLLAILWITPERPAELSYAALGTLGFMTMTVAWMRRKHNALEAEADSSTR